MTIRAVVFDLDGLMFDTEALFFRSASEVLESRGRRFTPEIMRAMIGRRSAEVAEALRTMARLEEPVEQIQAEIRRRFDEQVDTAVHPTPGLFALLDHLHRLEMPAAVATSSSQGYAARLLNGHRLMNRFAFVLGSEDVTRGKPDPEIYLRAAERFGVPAAELLVLEDSPAGLASACAAGAFAVAIPHEHSPADALAAANLIVPRLDDPRLLALIDDRTLAGEAR
ncbi:MAG: HAD family hydrolase [Isosphaeraceae bacterium]